jgi:hypothetical protein
MAAEEPRGLPFSRVYGRPEKLLENSDRLRLRLTMQVGLMFPDRGAAEYLGQYFALHHGLAVPHRAASGGPLFLFPNFFRESSTKDVLDALTAVFGALKVNPSEAKKWLALVRTALAEEHMAYRVDDECGLHPIVDAAFETARVAAIQALSGEQFAAARSHFEGAMDAIEENPPNTRSAVRNCFDAAENLFKLIVGGGQDLTEQNIQRSLRPQIDRLYGGLDAAAQGFANRMASGLADWTNATHIYRHAHADADVRDPDFELAVLHLNMGAGFVRWLAQMLVRLRS